MQEIALDRLTIQKSMHSALNLCSLSGSLLTEAKEKRLERVMVVEDPIQILATTTKNNEN
jgi:hypothetical protein